MKSYREMHDEFWRTSALTSLQRETVLDRLKSDDVEITARLGDVTAFNFFIYATPRLPHMSFRDEVYYSGVSFKEQLIGFASGDEVHLVARLNHAWINRSDNSEDDCSYKFELKAITRTRTREDIERERQVESLRTRPETFAEKRAREYVDDGVVFGGFWGAIILGIGGCEHLWNEVSGVGGVLSTLVVGALLGAVLGGVVGAAIGWFVARIALHL